MRRLATRGSPAPLPRFRPSHGGTGCGSAHNSDYFEQVATIRLCFLIIDALPYLV